MLTLFIIMLNKFSRQITLQIMLLIAVLTVLTLSRLESVENSEQPTVNDVQKGYLPVVVSNEAGGSCWNNGLGSILLTEQSSGESTAPYLLGLHEDGFRGMVGTPTYEEAGAYFPLFPGWDRVQVCNSHDCLRQRAQRAADENLDYEYLAYGPERLGGVPDEEKYNLPWATEEARNIAREWNKPLMISYSTKQLHQEAEERGFDWNNPSEVVATLAPYGDLWLIQAADEYWRLDDGSTRPILSQRVYPPGAEFRAEVQRWVSWIREANPEIGIWIQLAMQRIGVQGENQPSAETVIAYMDSISDLVDGVYLMPIYGSVDQFPEANREMVKVFQCSCGSRCSPQEEFQSTSEMEATNDIVLIEEGWTNDVNIPCAPNGDCLTILPDFYYRIYENRDYPCGAEGYHEFMVLDHDSDLTVPKHLFAKFLGGAVGFWYLDNDNMKLYYPNPNAAGILLARSNRNMFFRTALSQEFANGVTKRFRENDDFRILVPSYCSHDLYLGTGEYSEVDAFHRWGNLAAMAAVDFVQQHFNSGQLITYGGSAGAAGSFYIGKDQDRVAGIIMDSFAGDLKAISDACYDGTNVFGSGYPCFCPENGPTCMEALAPRIGFQLGEDEPYQLVEKGFDKPLYLVWNERDGTRYAPLHYINLHETIEQFNPAGRSVANMVCITDPNTPPGPICNLHVPSAYDYDETELLIQEIYTWALSQILSFDYQIFLPAAVN